MLHRLWTLVLGVFCACTFSAAALAQDAEPLSVPEPVQASTNDNAYGYNADDVAVNQAVVLYWYAHGYRNAFGTFPADYAALIEKGLPLRRFFSPHSGDAIDPDDGSLDFDGDMLYKAGGGYDVSVEVQTTTGVVSLPGTITATSDISGQYDPCCCPKLCHECVYIGCEECENWGLCDKQDAACKIVEWMLWKSFETHEALYGMRPADELAWMASGLAPMDKNYKEYVPTMDIEYIYSKGNCCVLKKAKVSCCAPCVPCKPCSPCETKCGKCKSECNSCDRCQGKCKDNCGTCKSKCSTCNTCKPKCSTARPCGKCDTCKPKCDTGCKSKCGKCNECKPKCDGGCKSKCGKCDSCKSKCGKCDKCRQDSCTKCKPDSPCGKCKSSSKCGSCEKPGCARCS